MLLVFNERPIPPRFFSASSPAARAEKIISVLRLFRAEFQFLPARLPAHKYIKQEHIPPREPDKECKIFRKYFLPGDSRVFQLRVARRIFLLLKLRDFVL